MIIQKIDQIYNIFDNKIVRKYWNNIANTYIPIKEEIKNRAKKIYQALFGKTRNILGVLIRGTDYIAKKPQYHAIQPTPEMVIKDIHEMNNKNKYDYFFIATEDDLIREKFILEFGIKLKYIKNPFIINYDYNKKDLLTFNNNVKGNLEFMKLDLINIIILSECLDIITSRTGGSLVVFILSKGYRNEKIYNLGAYK